jgi:RNA-directed DNA polymerase
MPNVIANYICKICLHPVSNSIRNDSLPQGNPTSTMLANIVIEKTVKRILNYLKPYDIKFTVWIDDWTFSSKKDFKNIVPEILSIIGRSGLKPSSKKTTYRYGKACITGAIVKLHTMKVTDEFREKELTQLKPRTKNRHGFI